MNLKSFFPLFMLEYAGVLRQFACVCVNMLKLLVFAFICWVRLCLREYAGVVYVCLYLLGSLVFVRSLLEYSGVCLNFTGSGQVGLSGYDPVGVDWMRAGCGPFGFDRRRPDKGRSVRLDAGQSSSPTLMRPGST